MVLDLYLERNTFFIMINVAPGEREFSPLPALINTSEASTRDTGVSPRGELSQMNMSISSGSAMLVSPEDVMKRIREEMGDEELDMSPKRGRQDSGSGSSCSQMSYIFSPILVKPGGEIRNISSITTSSGSGQSSAGMSARVRGANSSPMFTFDVTREMRNWKAGWRGRMDMTGGLLWGARSLRLSVNDTSTGSRAIEVSNAEGGGELEEVRDEIEEVDEDIFEISKVE